MNDSFTIDDYLERLRELYKAETMPLVKIYWMKAGLIVKQLLDEGHYIPFDAASEEFERDLYERMDWNGSHIHEQRSSG